ncbi:MAG: hypothetical protein GVY29_07945 [Spirochaetes bacterium]|jgi:hypothetical protein|nr:hypothetical protein [Spirochaetota bacterium]
MMKRRIVTILMWLLLSGAAVAEQSFSGVWILLTGPERFVPELQYLSKIDESHWIGTIINVRRRSSSSIIGKERAGSVFFSTAPNNLYQLRTRDDFETIEMIGIEGPGEFPGKTYRRLTAEDIARLEEFGVILPDGFTEND